MRSPWPFAEAGASYSQSSAATETATSGAQTRQPTDRLARPSVLWSPGFFHKTRFAASRFVFSPAFFARYGFSFLPFSGLHRTKVFGQPRASVSTICETCRAFERPDLKIPNRRRRNSEDDERVVSLRHRKPDTKARPSHMFKRELELHNSPQQTEDLSTMCIAFEALRIVKCMITKPRVLGPSKGNPARFANP
jgi:hypothetical protein